MYPWTTRVGGEWLGVAAVIPVGYAVSSVSFLLALVVLWHWVRRYGSAEMARIAVLLAAFNPVTT